MAHRLALLAAASSVIVSSGRLFSGSWISVEVGAQSCNVLNFGAKGDGKTDDTKAVQAAISACAGGGTTLLPSGYTCVLFALHE